MPFYKEADYKPYVDGRPRYDGVATFLASRGIDLPRGAASVAPVMHGEDARRPADPLRVFVDF